MIMHRNEAGNRERLRGWGTRGTEWKLRTQDGSTCSVQTPSRRKAARGSANPEVYVTRTEDRTEW